jgi:hypothetical protein
MTPHGISEFVPLHAAEPERTSRLRRVAHQLSVYSTPVGAFSDCTPSGKWSPLHEHLAAILPPPRPQTGTAAAVADAQAKAARLALEKARLEEEEKREEAEVEQLLRRSSIDEDELLCGTAEPPVKIETTSMETPRTPVKTRPRPRPRASPYLLSRIVPVSSEVRTDMAHLTVMPDQSLHLQRSK